MRNQSNPSDFKPQSRQLYTKSGVNHSTIHIEQNSRIFSARILVDFFMSVINRVAQIEDPGMFGIFFVSCGGGGIIFCTL